MDHRAHGVQSKCFMMGLLFFLDYLGILNRCLRLRILSSVSDDAGVRLNGSGVHGDLFFLSLDSLFGESLCWGSSIGMSRRSVLSMGNSGGILCSRLGLLLDKRSRSSSSVLGWCFSLLIDLFLRCLSFGRLIFLYILGHILSERLNKVIGEASLAPDFNGISLLLDTKECQKYERARN